MKRIIKKYSEKPKNLFGLLFWNLLFAYSPLALLIGVLSLFEITPVNFNDQELYGIKGLVVSLLFIPFVAGILAGLIWLYYSIGNWIMRLLGGILK